MLGGIYDCKILKTQLFHIFQKHWDACVTTVIYVVTYFTLSFSFGTHGPHFLHPPPPVSKKYANGISTKKTEEQWR